MGAWTTRIFDDDGAADIIADYRILLGYKVNPKEAYEIITNYYLKEYQDNDDEDVYWLAIALFQWQNGILEEQVKNMALKCIEEEKYMDRWKESGEKTYIKRKEILDTFRNKLLYEKNPTKITFPKCPKYYREKTPWNIGDLLAYQFMDQSTNRDNTAEKKCVLLRVVDVNSHPVTKLYPELDYNSNATIMLYDWMGTINSIPDNISNLKFKLIAIDRCNNIWRMASSVGLDYYNRKKDKEVCDIVHLGNEKKYLKEKPELYLRNNGSPWIMPIHFNNIIRQTFNLEDNLSKEWLYKE